MLNYIQLKIFKSTNSLDFCIFLKDEAKLSNAVRKLKDNVIVNMYFTTASSLQMSPPFFVFLTILIFIFFNLILFFLAWLEITNE